MGLMPSYRIIDIFIVNIQNLFINRYKVSVCYNL
ncbi:hypothetical protein CLSAP_29090 [Clostridium saccharoperbutylacetonicum]|nr:hypothetical protein CLSAP_29090 [Clostridium saccharoperbutylacetonicum]NSB31454.1 hypothetical protein [Clostridium saccharoperbutylacetonicum]